jgi:hypothetical protein
VAIVRPGLPALVRIVCDRFTPDGSEVTR